MSPILQELKDAASSLSAGERAELAQFLLCSLDEEDEEGMRDAWLALAEQRVAEVRAGEVAAVSADEFLKNRCVEEASEMLTDLSIYTIKHSDDLRISLAKGGRDTYSERKNWVRARRVLDRAKQANQRLPVIFAPAEGTLRLFAWALLDEVVPGEITSYSFSDLKLFEKQPLKTSLRKASDGQPIGKWFIRPYAICRTPPYLLNPRALSDTDLIETDEEEAEYDYSAECDHCGEEQDIEPQAKRVKCAACSQVFEVSWDEE